MANGLVWFVEFIDGSPAPRPATLNERRPLFSADEINPVLGPNAYRGGLRQHAAH